MLIKYFILKTWRLMDWQGQLAWVNKFRIDSGHIGLFKPAAGYTELLRNARYPLILLYFCCRRAAAVLASCCCCCPQHKAADSTPTTVPGDRPHFDTLKIERWNVRGSSWSVHDSCWQWRHRMSSHQVHLLVVCLSEGASESMRTTWGRCIINIIKRWWGAIL